MKNIFFSIFLCAAFSTAAWADATSEGVSTKIDPKTVSDLAHYIDNAKFTLDSELDNISKSPMSDQERLYADLMARVLTQSGSKPNEFLMRNILYRTQAIYADIKDLTSPDPDVNARRADYAVRILSDGLTWARKLYEADQKLLTLTRVDQLPKDLRPASFAKIGLEWAQYMLSLYYLAPDDNSRLTLMKDMMGLMYNDIKNDDGIRRILAPVAGGIAEKFESIKNKNLTSPLDKLLLARELRRFMEQYLDATKKLLLSYKTVFDADVQVNVPPVVQQISAPQDVSPLTSSYHDFDLQSHSGRLRIAEGLENEYECGLPAPRSGDEILVFVAPACDDPYTLFGGSAPRTRHIIMKGIYRSATSTDDDYVDFSDDVCVGTRIFHGVSDFEFFDVSQFGYAHGCAKGPYCVGQIARGSDACEDAPVQIIGIMCRNRVAVEYLEGKCKGLRDVLSIPK